MIQFAWRQNVERIIPIEFQNKKNEINSYVDYFIVFNETIKKEFQKYIKANYLTYGSFTSNSFNINTKNLIYKYLLVGQTANSNLNRYRESNQSTVGEYLQPDFDFYKVLIPYILKEKNEKINILAKSIDITKNTLNFYNDLVGENNFNLIDRTGYSYEIIDKSEIIIGTTSTLLYEALSRGKKTAIFSHKSKIKSSKIQNLVGSQKSKTKGVFGQTV